jgi:hypothetical protein
LHARQEKRAAVAGRRRPNDIALLATLIGFLFIAWSMRENGRYVYHPNTEDEAGPSVLDSRTGARFVLVKDSKGLFVEIKPQTGERTPRGLWTKGPSK